MPVLIYIILLVISGCNSGYSSDNSFIADEGALWELFGGLMILGGLFLFRGSSQNDYEEDELNDNENSHYKPERWQ